jgi:hypothetical protein
VSSGPVASTEAELSAAAEAIGTYERRVAGLAGLFLGTEREDLIAAIYEAERALRTAERALQRAVKIARS